MNICIARGQTTVQWRPGEGGRSWWRGSMVKSRLRRKERVQGEAFDAVEQCRWERLVIWIRVMALGGQRTCHTQIRCLEFKATGFNVLDVGNKGKQESDMTSRLHNWINWMDGGGISWDIGGGSGGRWCEKMFNLNMFNVCSFRVIPIEMASRVWST